MGFFQRLRKEKRWFLIWSPKLFRFTLQELVWNTPGWALDTLNKKAWELSPDLPTYFLKIGKKEYRVNILDEERGIGVYFEPDKELLKIRSNPDLSGQLVDAVLITMAMQLTPSNKRVIIAAIAGILLGLLFGMSM
jgi:hypothetical protein